jgi:hypothetical protein
MKKIVAVAMLAAMTLLGAMTTLAVATAASAGGRQQEVSSAQFDILMRQCRYAETASARAECRSGVKLNYRVGSFDSSLDCRTYSSVTVCGPLSLGPKERACLDESVRQGLTYRRAEVECYAFA